MPPLSAISLDFFNTLVYHRHGLGRGALLRAYFEAQGWSADPWKHSVLDDLFAVHGLEFAPDASPTDHLAFCTRVSRSLFTLSNVTGDRAYAEDHALALWNIVGPAHLSVFPEVADALRDLRALGLRLVIVSNWQPGLLGFCRALGIDSYFERIIASADVGFAKPDSRVFAQACERLGVPPEQVLHIGDSLAEDVNGARQAGLRALHLRRDVEASSDPATIRMLTDVVPIARSWLSIRT